jgi:hypothetical protein
MQSWLAVALPVPTASDLSLFLSCKPCPPEIQEEYRQEVEEARERQEAALRKQQEAELRRQQGERDAELRRQQGERDAELRRQQAERDEAARVVRAEVNRRQLERIRLEAEQDAKAKAEWKAQVNAATNEVPEEAAITNRYPALQAIAVIVKVITTIAVVAMWIGWFGYMAFTGHGDMSFLVALPLTLLVVFWSVFIWVLGYAQAEMILLAIDVANDMRINRFLHKSIR